MNCVSRLGLLEVDCSFLLFVLAVSFFALLSVLTLFSGILLLLFVHAVFLLIYIFAYQFGPRSLASAGFTCHMFFLSSTSSLCKCLLFLLL